MATAEELLATVSSSTEEVLKADLVNRVIIIPATLRVLGVESDDDVKRLYFEAPRYYGEFDLSEFKFHINFENARGGGDFWPVDDLTVNDDTLTFSWLVDRSAFKYAGDVNFSICMKKYNSAGVVVKELNTTFTSLPVLKGLETSKEVVESSPSAFDAVLFRLYAVEAATGLGQNGYYSIAKVSESGIGVEVTIINQDGETVALIKHGVDGYTPIKGVDYYTEEEKAEFKSVILQHLDEFCPIDATVTLKADSWSEKTQSVNVEGVTKNSIVIAVFGEHRKYGIRCIAKDDSVLTFECKTLPSIDVMPKVAIFRSNTNLKSGESLIVLDDGNGNVVIQC